MTENDNQFNLNSYNTQENNGINYNQSFNNKPTSKIILGLIIGIVILIVVVVSVFLLMNKGTKNNLFSNNNTIKLYSDDLTLAEGEIYKYNLYKKNGDEVNMKIYKMTDYLVAYQNVGKNNNYFGFAFYTLDNEKNYVLDSNDLTDNVENSGSIWSSINKKDDGFTSIHDIATEFGKSHTQYSDQEAKVDKISNSISKVTSIKIWGEKEYTFFIDIDNSHYFKIQVSCNPVTGSELESEVIKGTLKIFENLKIDLVDNNHEENVIQSNNKFSIDEKFEYYFAFKDIDVKKFNKSKALKCINDYKGNEVTTFPITYENLSLKFKPYYLKKELYFSEWIETTTVNTSEIHWGINSSERYFTTNFYNTGNSTIYEAMKNHNFYIEISRFYYNTVLGIPEDNSKDDIDLILDELGNPNEIYINSDIYTNKESADYYLVYNYNDYILAFNFTETSYEDRSKDSATYIPPYLEDVYYIDGDSFEKGLNGIKNNISENYYAATIDIVVK